MDGNINTSVEYDISSQENKKKVLRPFYHKKYSW